MELGHEYRWTVADVQTETPRIKNIYLESCSETPAFIAGQYLTVKLPNCSPAEGKAYSISSAPTQSQVRLSVKRIGAFSEALLSLQPGDELITTAPYGFFYPEPEDSSPLVFVVGGIGITPCLSIIKDLAYQQNARPVQLHYSNQTESDIAFFAELEQLTAQHPNLSVMHYVTREQPANDSVTLGRMTIKSLLSQVDLSTDAEFFICGSMDFTKTMWKGLHGAGVPQHQLYTEGFF